MPTTSKISQQKYSCKFATIHLIKTLFEHFQKKLLMDDSVRCVITFRRNFMMVAVSDLVNITHLGVTYVYGVGIL
jgi:hypothetical protein